MFHHSLNFDLLPLFTQIKVIIESSEESELDFAQFNTLITCALRGECINMVCQNTA
jgi:hypothetical protein